MSDEAGEMLRGEWAGAANNEIARRPCVWVRLDPKLSASRQREQFLDAARDAIIRLLAESDATIPLLAESGMMLLSDEPFQRFSAAKGLMSKERSAGRKNEVLVRTKNPRLPYASKEISYGPENRADYYEALREFFAEPSEPEDGN